MLMSIIDVGGMSRYAIVLAVMYYSCTYTIQKRPRVVGFQIPGIRLYKTKRHCCLKCYPFLSYNYMLLDIRSYIIDCKFI